MLVSNHLEVEGARVVREIGRLTATSGWHGAQCASGLHRDQALSALIRLAKDYEADAIIGVDYFTDDARALDLGELPVERIGVSGIAVKISRN